MNKSNYLVYSTLIIFLSASIWWELMRYYVRMAFAIGIFMSMLFLMYSIPKYYYTKFFAFLLLCSCFFFIPGLSMGTENVSIWIHTAPTILFLPFVCTGLFVYILICGDYKLLKITLIVASIFISFGAIKTMLGETNASRVFLANAKSVDALAQAVENIEEGIMGYAQIHAIPFIAIGIVCVVKSGNYIYKFLGVLIGGFCACALIKSGYTTATICTGVGVVLSCISMRRRGLTIALFLFVSIFMYCLVISGGLLAILEYIAPNLDQNSNLVAKIREFASMQTTVNGSEYWNTRTYKYELSWEQFLLNPFFGAGHGKEGGHSYLLDMLCVHGLFVFAIYISYFWMILKFIYSSLPKTGNWYYGVGIFIIFALLAFKANALMTQNYVICLILPLTLLINEQDFYFASFVMRKRFGMPPLYYNMEML